MRRILMGLAGIAVLACCGTVRAADEKPGIMIPKVNQEAIDKCGLRIGVQAYTFRAMSLFETLDLMKQMGVKYVELYPGQGLEKGGPRNQKVDINMAAEDLAAMLAKLKETGISATSFGVTGLPGDEAGARKAFEWGKKVGLEEFVIEPGYAKVANAETAEQPYKEPEKVNAYFTMLDKLAAEFGIKVAIHDHPKPAPMWHPNFVLAASKGHDNIGSCADVGHWVRSGLKPVDCMEILKGKIIEFHLKDVVKNARNQFDDIPWGDGADDAKGIMAAIIAQKPTNKPCFYIEYESSGGMKLQNNVARCIENFSRFCEELSAGK